MLKQEGRKGFQEGRRKMVMEEEGMKREGNDGESGDYLCVCPSQWEWAATSAVATLV